MKLRDTNEDKKFFEEKKQSLDRQADELREEKNKHSDPPSSPSLRLNLLKNLFGLVLGVPSYFVGLTLLEQLLCLFLLFILYAVNSTTTKLFVHAGVDGFMLLSIVRIIVVSIFDMSVFYALQKFLQNNEEADKERGRKILLVANLVYVIVDVVHAAASLYSGTYAELNLGVIFAVIALLS